MIGEIYCSYSFDGICISNQIAFMESTGQVALFLYCRSICVSTCACCSDPSQSSIVYSSFITDNSGRVVFMP